MILALDLGTRTGWALWDGTCRESGVQTFDLKRGESPGMRYLAFNRWLATLYADMHLGMIVYEAPHHRGGAATEIANGFSTRAQEFCARHGLQHAAVHSATLKKWTTGRGNATKPDMIEAVKRRWLYGLKGEPGSEVPAYEVHTSDLTDDEADAIALLEYARAELFPTR